MGNLGLLSFASCEIFLNVIQGVSNGAADLDVSRALPALSPCGQGSTLHAQQQCAFGLRQQIRHS
jgi:hypothetical protein